MSDELRDYLEARRARLLVERADDAAMQFASMPLLGGTDTAPHNGTETSKAAAESLSGSGTLQRLELLVLRGVIGLGSATREELEVILGLSGNCVRPRCASLLEKGLVMEQLDGSGAKATRPTASGRNAHVLVVTKKGFDAAAEANGGWANVRGQAA